MKLDSQLLEGFTILLIFPNASAGFALNKAVDWLFFTVRLPADPLDRLFLTLTYARVFQHFSGYKIDGQPMHEGDRKFVVLSDEPSDFGVSDAAPGPVPCPFSPKRAYSET